MRRNCYNKMKLKDERGEVEVTFTTSGEDEYHYAGDLHTEEFDVFKRVPDNTTFCA